MPRWIRTAANRIIDHPLFPGVCMLLALAAVIGIHEHQSKDKIPEVVFTTICIDGVWYRMSGTQGNYPVIGGPKINKDTLLPETCP